MSFTLANYLFGQALEMKSFETPLERFRFPTGRRSLFVAVEYVRDSHQIWFLQWKEHINLIELKGEP